MSEWVNEWMTWTTFVTYSTWILWLVCTWKENLNNKRDDCCCCCCCCSHHHNIFIWAHHLSYRPFINRHLACESARERISSTPYPFGSSTCMPRRAPLYFVCVTRFIFYTVFICVYTNIFIYLFRSFGRSFYCHYNLYARWSDFYVVETTFHLFGFVYVFIT